ncbi:hypothetical protein [Spiroplasma endosymbiont of Nebria brevicollis]|uniref:hypothetical protein n=1 Tax=Spiroplasma endosymbiont of Nebria brevicollis TaxID=3066284 RepID=UPI00313D931F
MNKNNDFNKNMSVYKLHKTNELDHEYGRPTILLKYKTQTSLIWWGTHLLDEKTYEKPLILKINNKTGYFYSKGIEG